MTSTTRRTCRRAAAGAAAALALTTVPALAGEPTAAGPRVHFRSTIGAPVDPTSVCAQAREGVRSEGMPLVGADPADARTLQATWSAHGEQLQMVGTSRDGGRTWTAEPLEDATTCGGRSGGRDFSFNTLFDVGAGGAGYVGQSWTHTTQTEFQFGVAVHRIGSGVPGGEPVAGDKASQNAAVVADPTDPDHVAVAWNAFTQVPNPLTYTPLPTEVRFAQSHDGGRTWTPYAVIHEAPAGELAVNPRLVRATDGGYVLLIDHGRIADFPGAQTGLTPAEFTFHARHSRDGREWGAPVLLGSGEFYTATRPDEGDAPGLAAVKPDLAAGPGNSVIASWHDVTRNTVRIARSLDGGRTWADAEDTVDLPELPYQVAVAIDGRGRPGLFWYDFRDDRVGDDAWTLRPWVAVLGRDGSWRETAVDEAFDFGAAADCTPGAVPIWADCTPSSHAGPFGVSQDLEGLDRGFGVAYTVAGHLARDGYTDVRYARVSSEGRAG